MELIFRIITMVLLICAAIFDIRNKKISVLFPATQVAISLLYWLYRFSEGKMEAWDVFLSFVPGLVLILICLLSRQGVGIGDGLLVLSLGPLLGMRNMLLAVLIAFTLTAIIGSVLLMLKRVNGKSTLAFVPFLAAGVGVMCFV